MGVLARGGTPRRLRWHVVCLLETILLHEIIVQSLDCLLRRKIEVLALLGAYGAHHYFSRLTGGLSLTRSESTCAHEHTLLGALLLPRVLFFIPIELGLRGAWSREVALTAFILLIGQSICL